MSVKPGLRYFAAASTRVDADVHPIKPASGDRPLLDYLTVATSVRSTVIKLPVS